MTTEVIVSLVGSLSALFGAAIGGVITYLTNRSMKEQEWELEIIKEEIAERKSLYAKFLNESSDLVMEAFQNKHSDIRKFKKLGSLVAEIELIGSEEVSLKAKHISDLVFTSHAEGLKPDKPFAELRESFVISVKKELDELKNT